MTLWLPATEPPGDDDEDAEDGAPPPPAQQGLALLVDDDAQVRRVFRRSLLELGYAVLVDDAQAPAHWAERLPPLQIPEDEDSGRGALELRAATQDALVVGLARSFWNLCNGHGEFTPRRIDLALARARLAAR